MIRSDLTIWCAVTAFLLPSTSFAAEAVDEATARALFAEGRKLAASGDHAAACPKFEESYRLDPGIGTSFNLADCWEHTGRTASAWARFLAVAASAKAAGQTEREQVARERAAALESRLSRLVVQVDSPVEGLTVERDAIPVGRASWGVPVPMDPGAHVIQAAAPGKKTSSVAVTVPSSSGTVTVTIARLEDVPAAVPSAPPPPAAVASPKPIEAPHPSRSLVPVITVGAIGVAALAVGAVYGLQFQSVNGDAKQLCPGNTCTQDEKDHHERLTAEAHHDLKVAYLSAAAGGVALTAAALLWWRPGPLRARPSTAAFEARALVFSWGGGVGPAVEGRW